MGPTVAFGSCEDDGNNFLARVGLTIDKHKNSSEKRAAYMVKRLIQEKRTVSNKGRRIARKQSFQLKVDDAHLPYLRPVHGFAAGPLAQDLPVWSNVDIGADGLYERWG